MKKAVIYLKKVGASLEITDNEIGALLGLMLQNELTFGIRQGDFRSFQLVGQQLNEKAALMGAFLMRINGKSNSRWEVRIKRSRECLLLDRDHGFVVVKH